MSTLGEKLTDALRESTEARETVEVEVGGLRAIIEVTGSGPYGAEVRRLRVQGPGDVGVEAVVDVIEKAVTYLPERLEPLEVDAASDRGILRTARAQVQGREYYEVEVKDGGVDFARYRYTAPGERATVDENFGHGSLKRLVDDLGDALSD